MPGSIAMAVVSPFAGKIYDKVGMKVLFVSGAFFMMLSNIGMYFIGMDTPLWLPAFYNVVRCVSIGCLMMPLVTWGTGFIGKDKTAHATALLTSLRTVAGAMGSAVFVGIMTVVANNSAQSYGSNAGIHGLNAAFMAMAASSLVLLLISVFAVKKESK
jgi:MFS family permease